MHYVCPPLCLCSRWGSVGTTLYTSPCLVYAAQRPMQCGICLTASFILLLLRTGVISTTPGVLECISSAQLRPTHALVRWVFFHMMIEYVNMSKINRTARHDPDLEGWEIWPSELGRKKTVQTNINAHFCATRLIFKLMCMQAVSSLRSATTWECPATRHLQQFCISLLDAVYAERFDAHLCVTPLTRCSTPPYPL